MARGMNRAALQRRLLAWYAANKRGLPWRGARDPYRVWLSEVMLQQTRVAAVVDHYRRFVRRFPAVQTVARAGREEVLRMWAGLGYYGRARNLHRAAREMVLRHGGRFPRDYDTARTLPGVGPYTAAAVTSIAYGAHQAVLDGNVARVLARLFALRGEVRAPQRWARLQELAQQLLPGGTRRAAGASAGDWNQAMMELGATVCTPRAPRCGACPVQRWCRAQARGLAGQIPAVRRKRAAETVRLAVAVLHDPSGRTKLMREDKQYFARLWHFPFVPAGVEARRRLAQRLHNGKAGHSTRLRFEELSPVRHTVTLRRIQATPFLSRVAGLPRSARGERMVRLDRLDNVAVSSLTRKIAQAALERLDRG